MEGSLFKVMLAVFVLSGISVFANGNNYRNYKDRVKESEVKSKYVRIGSNNTRLSSERAKQIALSHAGVSERDARITKIKLDMENGILVYEIEFYVGNRRYEYNIDANTGEIR